MSTQRVVITLNIESGLLTKALYEDNKLVTLGGVKVKWEEIELNHVVIHGRDKDMYFECIECVGALAILKEVE